MKKRYEEDEEFRSLVNLFSSLLTNRDFTVKDINDALSLSQNYLGMPTTFSSGNMLEDAVAGYKNQLQRSIASIGDKLYQDAVSKGIINDPDEANIIKMQQEQFFQSYASTNREPVLKVNSDFFKMKDKETCNPDIITIEELEERERQMATVRKILSSVQHENCKCNIKENIK